MNDVTGKHYQTLKCFHVHRNSLTKQKIEHSEIITDIRVHNADACISFNKKRVMEDDYTTF